MKKQLLESNGVLQSFDIKNEFNESNKNYVNNQTEDSNGTFIRKSFSFAVLKPKIISKFSNKKNNASVNPITGEDLKNEIFEKRTNKSFHQNNFKHTDIFNLNIPQDEGLKT
jgi:hypothetical protein